MPYRLLSELLGAHETTISLAARRITPILARHGITPNTSRTPISTLAQLREHAATAQITITLPGNTSEQTPEHPPAPEHNTPN